MPGPGKNKQAPVRGTEGLSYINIGSFALRGGVYFLGLPGARPVVQGYAGNLQFFRMMCRGFDSRRVW